MHSCTGWNFGEDVNNSMAESVREKRISLAKQSLKSDSLLEHPHGRSSIGVGREISWRESVGGRGGSGGTSVLSLNDGLPNGKARSERKGIPEKEEILEKQKRKEKEIAKGTMEEMEECVREGEMENEDCVSSTACNSPVRLENRNSQEFM